MPPPNNPLGPARRPQPASHAVQHFLRSAEGLSGVEAQAARAQDGSCGLPHASAKSSYRHFLQPEISPPTTCYTPGPPAKAEPSPMPPRLRSRSRARHADGHIARLRRPDLRAPDAHPDALRDPSRGRATGMRSSIIASQLPGGTGHAVVALLGCGHCASQSAHNVTVPHTLRAATRTTVGSRPIFPAGTAPASRRAVRCYRHLPLDAGRLKPAASPVSRGCERQATDHPPHHPASVVGNRSRLLKEIAESRHGPREKRHAAAK